MPLKFLPSRKKNASADPAVDDATSAPAAVAEPVSAEPVAAQPPAEDKPAKEKASGGMRDAINRMMAVFLFVAAVTIAIGSTLVAKRTIAERDQLRTDLAASQKAFDDVVMAAATNSRLKGPANAQARVEILTPAIQGYQAVVSANNQNPEKLDLAAAAAFRAAGLQAKTGSPGCVGSLQAGMEALRRMGEEGYEIERFPSLNDTALRMTAPMDWATMKDTNLQAHAVGLLYAFQQSVGVLNELAAKYPQAATFRSDLAGLQKMSATLQTAVPERATFAVRAWLEARDALESLVRDQPGNVEFQSRLAEALAGAANLQRQHGETDEAIANYQRAVEVRQQMVDANPEDKALADELAKVKGSLAKLQPGG